MYGIFLNTDDGYMILGTKSGEQLWFDTLDEVIEFIEVFDISVHSDTVVLYILGDFIVREHRAADINKLLEERKTIKSTT